MKWDAIVGDNATVPSDLDQHRTLATPASQTIRRKQSRTLWHGENKVAGTYPPYSTKPSLMTLMRIDDGLWEEKEQPDILIKL